MRPSPRRPTCSTATAISTLFSLRRPPRAGLSCAPVGLVHLDAARQPVPAWPDHGAAELVQPRPRRLVASQTQGSLQPQGAHPTLLVGDPPHRPKPRRQWRPRVLEDRPRRHRGLVGAVRALPPPFPDAPGLRPITARAPKSLRPPELLQIRLTRLLGRESALEFGHISGILLHRLVRYILGLPESSKYLVSTKPRRRGPGRPFRKGQSGNPGGRPRTKGLVQELKRLCGQNGGKLIRGILEMAQDESVPARTRLAAFETLLAYGWGKPSEMGELPDQTAVPVVHEIVFGGRYKPDGSLVRPAEDSLLHRLNTETCGSPGGR